VTAAQMKELDEALGLTKRTNAEVIFQWLLLSVQAVITPRRGASWGRSQDRKIARSQLFEGSLPEPASDRSPTRLGAW
jgi:hypothetical protein